MDQEARRVKQIASRIAEANGLADDFMWKIIVVRNDSDNATGIALPDGKVPSHLLCDILSYTFFCRVGRGVWQ